MSLVDSEIWSGLIPERDLQIYEAAGYGSSQTPGARPAVLVIDTNYRFAGREPLPIEKAVLSMRTSCGQFAWDAIPKIALLLRMARSNNIPVIYSTSPKSYSDAEMQAWRSKNARVDDDLRAESDDADIVNEVAPVEGDLVIRKVRPSVFFGTDLKQELDQLGVDSIVCVGGSTSGCVRGTVVDAFSHGIQATVVADGSFDRSDFIHRVSLFDMQAKYANVVSLKQLAEQWRASGITV